MDKENMVCVSTSLCWNLCQRVYPQCFYFICIYEIKYVYIFIYENVVYIYINVVCVYVYIYIYIYNATYIGVLFSHKKERNPAIFDNMDRSWSYEVKSNKPGRERQLLHNITYMWNKREKKAKFLEMGCRNLIARVSRVGEIEIGKRPQTFSCKMNKVEDLV